MLDDADGELKVTVGDGVSWVTEGDQQDLWIRLSKGDLQSKGWTAPHGRGAKCTPPIPVPAASWAPKATDCHIGMVSAILVR
jgi:hypothetical protein